MGTHQTTTTTTPTTMDTQRKSPVGDRSPKVLISRHPVVHPVIHSSSHPVIQSFVS